MESRIVEFIGGLRAAGVRVSLAESQDAFRAVKVMGAIDREAFKSALRSTLVKEHSDRPVFDKLFPLYFGSGGPPFMQPDQALSPEERQKLEAALRALAGDLSKLLRMLASGQAPSQEDMDRAAQRAGVSRSRNPEHQQWLTREMLRQMGLGDLAKQIEALLAELAAMGMTAEGIERMRELLQANREALSEQTSQYVGQSIAKRLAQSQPRPPSEADLVDRPFADLTEAEARELRKLVTRLAARLRSRAALRQKRGDGRTLDVKTTLRENLRTGGVPFDLHFKKRHIKPKLALICDVSTSMRPAAEFLLRLMYELQDQIAKARSFAFIDHMEEVSDEFAAQRPAEAIPFVLHRIPPGHYNTDLGASLNDFHEHFFDAVDSKTTVVVLGDGRNNFNDPRLDLVTRIRRQSRRLLWFNPEPDHLWGTGDSDMLQYVPVCDKVHQVSSLAELTDAVDRLFTT